jgi:hypothetical protein
MRPSSSSSVRTSSPPRRTKVDPDHRSHPSRSKNAWDPVEERPDLEVVLNKPREPAHDLGTQPASLLGRARGYALDIAGEEMPMVHLQYAGDRCRVRNDRLTPCHDDMPPAESVGPILGGEIAGEGLVGQFADPTKDVV